METAAKYDRPPSYWWGNRGEWLDKDYALTLGYTIYRDGLNELGFPRHEARHPDNDGWYEAETVVDYSVAALEQHSKDNPKPTPGDRVVVRYTRPEGKPLSVLGGGLLDDPNNEQGETREPE